jgi:hypothetical protein
VAHLKATSRSRRTARKFEGRCGGPRRRKPALQRRPRSANETAPLPAMSR